MVGVIELNCFTPHFLKGALSHQKIQTSIVEIHSWPVPLHGNGQLPAEYRRKPGFTLFPFPAFSFICKPAWCARKIFRSRLIAAFENFCEFAQGKH
jgi:hypothetical protein